MLFQAAARFVHKTFKNSSMAITKMIGAVGQMALANHPCKGLYFVTPQMYVNHCLYFFHQFPQLEMITQMIRRYRHPTRTRLCLYMINLAIIINVYHQRHSHHHNLSNHFDKYRNCSNIKTIQTCQGLHQNIEL